MSKSWSEFGMKLYINVTSICLRHSVVRSEERSRKRYKTLIANRQCWMKFIFSLLKSIFMLVHYSNHKFYVYSHGTIKIIANCIGLLIFFSVLIACLPYIQYLHFNSITTQFNYQTIIIHSSHWGSLFMDYFFVCKIILLSRHIGISPLDIVYSFNISTAKKNSF